MIYLSKFVCSAGHVLLSTYLDDADVPQDRADQEFRGILKTMGAPCRCTCDSEIMTVENRPTDFVDMKEVEQWLEIC